MAVPQYGINMRGTRVILDAASLAGPKGTTGTIEAWDSSAIVRILWDNGTTRRHYSNRVQLLHTVTTTHERW